MPRGINYTNKAVETKETFVNIKDDQDFQQTTTSVPLDPPLEDDDILAETKIEECEPAKPIESLSTQAYQPMGGEIWAALAAHQDPSFNNLHDSSMPFHDDNNNNNPETVDNSNTNHVIQQLEETQQQEEQQQQEKTHTASTPNTLKIVATQHNNEEQVSDKDEKPPVGSDEWHKLRRENHKQVERKRREIINEGINEIARIVPGCEKNKGSILQRAAVYIRQLKEAETATVEKWTLEKLLTDQAISELNRQVELLKSELERTRLENSYLKRELDSHHSSPKRQKLDHED